MSMPLESPTRVSSVVDFTGSGTAASDGLAKTRAAKATSTNQRERDMATSCVGNREAVAGPGANEPSAPLAISSRNVRDLRRQPHRFQRNPPRDQGTRSGEPRQPTPAPPFVENEGRERTEQKKRKISGAPDGTGIAAVS